MRYLLVADIAKKWNMSERSVRNYCAQGRVNGAFLTGKTWNIPENAEKPACNRLEECCRRSHSDRSGRLQWGLRDESRH